MLTDFVNFCELRSQGIFDFRKLYVNVPEICHTLNDMIDTMCLFYSLEPDAILCFFLQCDPCSAYMLQSLS